MTLVPSVPPNSRAAASLFSAVMGWPAFLARQCNPTNRHVGAR